MADGLDLKLIQKFNKQLDETYEKLIKLDAELKKFEKLTTVDVKTGPGLRATARALDELARAMKTFSASSPERVSNAAKGIIQFVDQFALAAKKSETKNIGSLARFIRESASALKELGALQAGFSGTSKGQKNSAKRLVDDTILPLVKMIKELLRLGSNITPERLRSISDAFRSIGGLFQVLADVTTTVGRLASGAGPGKKDLDQFKNVFKMVTDLLSLTQKEDLTPGRIQAAANAFQQVGTLFSTLFDISDRLDKLSGRSVFKNFLRVDPVKQFQKILGIVRSFFYIAQNLSPERLANLASAFHGVEQLFRALGETVNVLDTVSKKFHFPTGLIRDILVFKRIIQPFLDVAQLLSRTATQNTGPALTGFRDLVRGLADAVEIIGTISGKFHKIGGLFRDLLTFERIADVLSKVAGRFNRELGGVNPQAFSALEPLVRAINRTIRLLLELETEFREFGSLLRSLSLFERAAGRLVNIAKEFAKIKGNAETLKGAASLIEGLVRFFRELLLINNDKTSFENLDKNLGFIEKIGKRLGVVLKSIANNAGVGNVKDLAALLENLRSLKDVAEIFNKDVGKDINDTTSVFTRLREVISGAVTEGILRANLLIKVFNALKIVALQLGKAFFKLIFPPAVVIGNLRSLKEMGDALREIGDNIRDVGEQMRDFGSQFIQNFGIGRLFESAVVQAAVGFDQLSTQVQIFGNLTDEATEQAEALAFEIGQKFPLSANDALAAILDLVKAGQDLGSIEFVLPAASNLAALSETGDLDGVISTLIAAEGAFDTFAVGVEGTFENIAIATDILAAGANVSTASVESLGEGLANVGTAANSFGLSLEETVAVLAIFNDAGLQAAEGGTALRSLLNALDRPQTAAALERLNVALFDPETGTRRPLNDIINDINLALQDMPDAQRVAVLQELSDTFGRQGLNILLGEGADGIANVVDEMGALPTAAEQASQLLDNLAGDVLQLQGSVETFMLRAALPMLERFFRPFVQIARLAVDGVLSLNEGFFEFLGTSIAISSVLATLIGGFLIFTGTVLQVGGVIFSVIGTLLNLQLVLGGLAAFSGAFVTGILAITAALVIFVPIVTLVTGVFNSLFTIFQTDAGGAASAANVFFTTLGKIVGEVIGLFVALGQVFRVLDAGVATEGDFFSIIGSAIAGFFTPLINLLNSGAIGQVRDFIADFTQILTGVGQLFDIQSQLRSDLTDKDVGNAIEQQFQDFAVSLLAGNEILNAAVTRIFGSASSANIGLFFQQLIAQITNLGGLFDKGIIQPFTAFADSIGKIPLSDAFNNLLYQLNFGAGNLIVGLIDIFETLFGANDITDILQKAAGDGLGSFGSTLVSLIVDSIRNAIIDNRGTLKDMFLGLVDSFFGLLRNLRFITDLLGAGPISNLFESFQGVLRDLLGGVFDTLINLIAGQSLGDALRNAFGDSIEPLFEFVETIQRIFGSIQRIFSNIFGFFSSGNPLEGAGDFFNFDGIIQGILDFAATVADFFDLLAIGDVNTIIQRIQEFFRGIFDSGVNFVSDLLPNIATFLSTFFADLGQAFKDYLISIGVPPEFITFGEDVFNSVITAVGDAFSSASTTVKAAAAEPVGFFTAIRDQLTSFLSTDGPALFATVGTNLLNTVTTAVETAFTGIEDVLNIDFQPAIDKISTSLTALFDAVEELLFGDEATGEVTIIEDIITLIERITTAIAGLFAAFPEDTDGVNQPLQFVLDFAADITSIGIDTITDLVVAVDDLLDFLTTADPGAIAALGVAIAVFSGPLVLGALTTALGFVTAAWSLFVTTLNGVILPALAVFIVVRALIQNVDELLDVFEQLGEGDWGGALEQFGDALLNIFADITEQVGPLINLLLGFFGIEPLNFNSDAVVALGRGLYEAFFNAAKALEIFFDRFLADLDARFIIMGREISDALTIGEDTVFGNIRTTLDPANEATLDELNDLTASLLTPSDVRVAAAVAVTNQEALSEQIRNEIRTSIANGEPVPVSVRDIMTLRDLEILQRTIEDALYSADIDVLNAIIDTGALTTEEYQELADQIVYAVQQGFITAEEGEALLLNLQVQPGEVVMDSDAKNQIIADAQAQLDAGDTPPVEVDVPVEVTPVPADADGDGIVTIEELEAEAAAKAAAAQEELNRQAPVPIYVPYTTELVPADETGGGEAPADGDEAPVAEDLDLAGASAEDVAQLTTDLQNLQTYAALVKVDLEALLPVLVQLGADLTTTQEAFDANNASMLLYLDQLSGINFQISLMSLNLILLNLNTVLLALSFTNLGTVALAALTLINDGFTIFYNHLLVLLNTMIQGFALVIESAQSLSKVLGDVIARAQNIAAVVEAANAGAGGGAETGDGRAHGGTTEAGTQHPVIEGGPEVYEENGRFYLISNKDGYVMPLRTSLSSVRNSASSGMYPTVSAAGAGAGGAGTINNVSFGDTNIDVTIDGSTGDLQAIARAAAEAVTNAMQNQQDNVRRTLRKNHR